MLSLRGSRQNNDPSTGKQEAHKIMLNPVGSRKSNVPTTGSRKMLLLRGNRKYKKFPFYGEGRSSLPHIMYEITVPILKLFRLIYIKILPIFLEIYILVKRDSPWSLCNSISWSKRDSLSQNWSNI